MSFQHRIYATEGMTKTFQTSVTSCTLSPEGNWEIVLSETAFFPGGGGQENDIGFFRYKGKSIEVFRVYEKEDTIYHVTREEIPVGEIICGEIDWTVRFPRMQNHSGEHILSGLIHKQFGFDNVGFHMGKDFITLDVSGEMSEEMIRLTEEKANEVVFHNLPISILFPNESELSTIDYRSKKELQGQVRLVAIPDTDVCACCAPHVAYTGEIGIIKILDSMKNKSGTRLTVLCGTDAFRYFQACVQREHMLSSFLSSPPEKLMEALTHLADEKNELKQKMNELVRTDLLREAQTLPVIHDVIVLRRDGVDNDLLRVFANEAANRCRMAIGMAKTENGFRFVAVSLKEDLGEWMKEFKDQLGAKGGGRGTLIMGTFGKEEETIRSYFSTLFV